MPKYQTNWYAEMTIEVEAEDEEEAMEKAYNILYVPGVLDDVYWDCNECMEIDWED